MGRGHQTSAVQQSELSRVGSHANEVASVDSAWPADEETILELFEMDGSVLPGGFSVARKNDGRSIAFDSASRYFDVLHNNKKVGRVSIVFGPVVIDPSHEDVPQLSELTLYSIHLNEEANLRRKGFSRAYVTELISRMREHGVREMKVSAVEDGRWVWRKFFEASPLDEYKKQNAFVVANHILDLHRDYEGSITPSDMRKWARFVKNNDEAVITMLDVHDFKVSDGRTIAELAQSDLVRQRFTKTAQETLLSWNGSIRLKQRY